jgi:pimeloyl-ACP methyl ester carboxylesterase
MNATQKTCSEITSTIRVWFTVAASATAVLLAGCVNPVGADRVSTQAAYAQVDANALRTSKPSAETISLLHRYQLEEVAERHPDEAVKALHQRALSTNERDLLFALAEMSYRAGDEIRHSMKSYDRQIARDYYLGSAMYAWLYLFGESKEPRPGMYDRRFREACDFYNYSLGLALVGERETNAVVQLVGGPRKLPVGEIEIDVSQVGLGSRLDSFYQILVADLFRVRGLSVRNRDAGVGAPLICVGQLNQEINMRQSAPATALLRGPRSLKELSTGRPACSLELHSALDSPTVEIAGEKVPLEVDLTTYRAYTLNQSFVWALGLMQFLHPEKTIRSQVILSQPYTPGRIPVVFVHGTFSSPVTWAEAMNSLTADPELRNRYQLWMFVYSSGNPLPISSAELRKALTDTVHRLDPEGKDPALRQMVVIGHSQGSLLTKWTVTQPGDKVWKLFSEKSLEKSGLDAASQAKVRELLYYEPLPFVKRVVYICGPHRGSYLSGGFARTLARKFMTFPSRMVQNSKQLLEFTKTSSDQRVAKFFNGKLPMSMDGMSPKNPVLLTMADIPVPPGIKSHSLIAVTGKGDYHKGVDGVVAYTSAHQDYTDSEFIVHGPHTCLNQADTIEELRRILHEHLDQLPPGATDVKQQAAQSREGAPSGASK